MSSNVKASLLISIACALLGAICVLVVRCSEPTAEVDDTKAVEPLETTAQIRIEAPTETSNSIPALTADTPRIKTTETERTEPLTTETEFEPIYTTNDIEMLAKTLYGECRGVVGDTHKAAVVWCILNRVDATGFGFGNSIEYVITFPDQFHGYDVDYPVTDELAAIAEDVLQRWQREKEGETDVGRVLPKEYLWFHGDGKYNYFRDAYRGGNTWDWSLPSPYGE